MKRFFPVLLLWLASCATPYTAITPTPLYAVQDSYAARYPETKPIYSVQAGLTFYAIGYYGNWWVLEDRPGRVCFVPRTALSLDPSKAPAPPQPSPPTYSSGYYPLAPAGTTHDVYTGPRGGQYYINGNGNRTYVTPQSTIDTRPIQTGARGGQYYINDNGRKTYIKH